MTPIDASMEPMLDMFIFETTTLLEQLDEIMIEAEKSGLLSIEAINEIFRIMHTIKGSSAMMGQENMTDLSHHFEDLFFLLRDDPTTLHKNSESIFDLLFKSSDYLKAAITSLQDRIPAPSGSEELIKLISQEANKLKGLSQEENSNKQDNQEIHQIRVFFQDDSQMENIRAFMLMTQIKECCDWLDSVPANPESNSQLSAEIIKNGFLIRFILNTELSDVINIVENSVNISTYELLSPASTSTSETNNLNNTVVEEIQSLGTINKATKNSNPTQQINNSKAGKQSLISVNQTKLDQLMDIVSEIVIAESMVASNPELKGLQLDHFHKSTRQLRKLTDELQDIVMSIRMVPLSGLFQKMNRVVRDMNKKLNKNVILETVGDETEVDKSISDIISDPFMHMIRNAMDHAIETPDERANLGKPTAGKITITAQNIGGEIVIIVSDDGRGLNKKDIINKAKAKDLLSKDETDYSDKEIFGMIMMPGFSTNEEVTEYSGRGVGMDVVRKNIEKMGGSVNIESKENMGTSFIIKIPLTLAIVDGMEIAVSDMVFTLPITSIMETFELSDTTQILLDTNGNEMILVRGQCYPIIRLHQIFEISNCKTNLEHGIMILIENDNKRACLFADDLIGEQQVVVKPFPQFLNRYNIKSIGLAGCTILGDGSISLILDANNLLNNF